jgi:hypothetical protein
MNVFNYIELIILLECPKEVSTQDILLEYAPEVEEEPTDGEPKHLGYGYPYPPDGSHVETATADLLDLVGVYIHLPMSEDVPVWILFHVLDVGYVLVELCLLPPSPEVEGGLSYVEVDCQEQQKEEE